MVLTEVAQLLWGGTHGYGFGYFIEVREVGVVIRDTNSLQS